MDSAALAQKLTDYDANPVTATTALNTALGTFGVPEIRNTVSGLRTTVANTTNALNEVDPSVTGRTQGSLVTEAQRAAQVNNERAPIAQNLTDENNSLNENQQALTDALGEATTSANNAVSDYNSGRTALQDEYNDTYQREQDTAKSAADAAASAEQQREFNVSQATTRGSSSYNGGSNTPLSKTQVTAGIRQGLESVKGGDGHVAPADLAKAYDDWMQSGLSDADFWSAFQGYWNPNQGNYKQQFNAAK